MPESVLFTVGHSLAKVDQHIANRIGACKAEAVFIGCYDGPAWRRADVLAAEWRDYREQCGLVPMAVYAFDSRQCPIWSGV